MLKYIDNQNVLREIFLAGARQAELPESGVMIRRMPFESGVGRLAEKESQSSISGLMVRSHEVNNRFDYPVFMPSKEGQADGAIIMMHGLNERNWNKYLSWAQYLASKTGKGVILFPMAFHVNRSPGSWSDPRLMKPVADARCGMDSDNADSTIFNAALSTRLESHPEWFCTSGLQTSYDVLQLVRNIRAGLHPLFAYGTRVDFFAYSVGAFLLEVMLMADPDEVLSESRSFLFLGGSSFEQMKGISRFIMDARAFDRLEEAFIRKDPAVVRDMIHLPRLDSFNPLWNGFMSMLRLDRLQNSRERRMKGMSHRISALALSNDKVIPARAISRTLKGERRTSKIPIEVMDFPYPCIHENPFPVNQSDWAPAVNATFERVFSKAAAFLGT